MTVGVISVEDEEMTMEEAGLDGTVKQNGKSGTENGSKMNTVAS